MQPGDVIDDRFEIERLAAAGGMGHVFRAKDRLTDSPVAVKVLLGGQVTDLERFRRETRVLAELHHPGIVRHITHGTIEPAGAPYLVMEWLEGEDLGSRLRRGRLTVQESLAVATQTAVALGVAHAQGIVHRDLKPKNLFLLEGRIDQVKLLDFGIARTEGAAQMTQAGMLMGTPGYMAPEQCKSEQSVDARVDVYALGCVLFECLTGRPAFKGQHAMSILVKILFEEPPRVSDFLPSVPVEIDTLVTQLLSKDRDRRPASGAAAALLLGALAARDWPTAETAGTSFPQRARTSVLTRVEQRMLSVILIGRKRRNKGTVSRVTGTVELLPEDEVAAEIQTFGGRLERLIDGSMMVTLAGERMATDQAALAARCALAIEGRYPGRWITVATGYGELMGRTEMTDAIDRAAGLLASDTQTPSSDDAEPAGILIDEVTAGLLDARFDVRESSVGLVLKGLRILPEGTRTLLGRPTACVGRDRELMLLEQAFSTCVEESLAQAVLVTALPGMGKSRLAQEFLARLKQHDRPVSIWMGQGDVLAADSALALLAQVLRSACGLREGEPLAERREKLTARVAEHVAEPERVRVAAFLGELTGTPFPDEGNAQLRAARKDAQLMNEQLRTAWLDFLRAECAVQPLVVVLEDVQWGDLPTARFIDAALRELRELPWMVLALGRPEGRERLSRLWSGRAMQVLPLQPLSRKAGERLVRQVLGERAGGELVARLIERADGNPFYLEELIRSTDRHRTGTLPETVIAMVQSRLASLDEEARRTLRAASVFGDVFWVGAVAALLGSDAQPTRMRDQFKSLVDQEVLVRRPESRLAGEEEYGFRHALLREGAYAMLVDEDRVVGHRLAGEWLEGHGEHDAIVLAEHFARGHEPARAARYYLRAAEHALVAGDMETAEAHAKRGLACGGPEEVRVELLGILCEAYLWRLQWEAVVPYLEEALRLAQPGTVPWARAMVIRLSSAMWHSRTEELLATIEALRQVTPTPAALSSVVFALSAGTYFLDHAGSVGAADALIERMKALTEPVAAEEPYALGWLYCNLSRRIGLLKDDPWEGLRLGELTVARFEEAGNRTTGRYGGLLFVAINQWLLGALEEAETELRNLQVADESMSDGMAFRCYALASVLLDRGAFEEGRREAERMVEVGRSRGLFSAEGRGLWALADALYRQGEHVPAEEAARAACDRLAPLATDHVPAQATLAAILLAQGRAPEALAVIEEAMAQYRRVGFCNFARSAYVRTVHAECLHATGDEEGARAEIAQARKMLLDMASRLGDPAHRERFFALPERVRTFKLAREWLGETPDAPG
ncbi:MAG TPA: protein kinase [Polyangia bacterium]|jgi:tetratricopeptide (TPR) repeat protein|nr:protein kinase [Polyangia bacterium]